MIKIYQGKQPKSTMDTGNRKLSEDNISHATDMAMDPIPNHGAAQGQQRSSNR